MPQRKPAASRRQALKTNNLPVTAPPASAPANSLAEGSTYVVFLGGDRLAVPGVGEVQFDERGNLVLRAVDGGIAGLFPPGVALIRQAA